MRPPSTAPWAAAPARRSIFGATGGVMDAALRSAYYLVTGKNPDPDAFRDIRGMDGWKDAKFEHSRRGSGFRGCGQRPAATPAS